MSILVANMFEADLTRFQFVFSTNACIKTLIYFSIMYFVVMIFNTINISKCKLIDLMHSNKKSEKIKLKNPLFCTIVFIISCIALGFAYYQVTGGIEKMTNANSIFCSYRSRCYFQLSLCFGLYRACFLKNIYKYEEHLL